MGECESRYRTYSNGECVDVVPLEESFRSVRTHIERVEQENKWLREENEKLKDEVYKDKELIALKEELEEAQEALRRGFPISEDEEKRINDWIKRHEEKKHGVNFLNKRISRAGAIGGAYTYEFTPTSIGTFCSVRCSCGESFDF